MIKNIVFDLGNVLVDFVPTAFIQRYTSDPVEGKALVEAIFASPEWVAFDRGTITKEEIKATAVKKLPHLAETIELILEKWHHVITPREDILPLIADLKAQGYQLYLLSNAPVDFYLFEEQVPVLQAFDGLFISSDWKMIKPEQEIYRTFCHQFQLVPSQCVFIDDLAINVEAARQVGMASFVYRKDVAELQENLRSIGIDC